MKPFKQNIFNLIVILSIFFSLFIIPIKITLASKYLYYYDIGRLKISESSGLSREDIIKNYTYMVDYISNNRNYNFNLPSIPSSFEGQTHFKEVRDLIHGFNYILYLFLPIAIIGSYICFRTKRYSIFKFASICLILIPIILLFPFTINFDKSFEIFHKIFFRNDYWLFDPIKDPVINILPQTFFFHCALMIISLLLLNGFILALIYIKKSTR